MQLPGKLYNLESSTPAYRFTVPGAVYRSSESKTYLFVLSFN